MAMAAYPPSPGPSVVTAADLSSGVLPPEAPPGSWSRLPRMRLSRSRTAHSLMRDGDGDGEGDGSDYGMIPVVSIAALHIHMCER